MIGLFDEPQANLDDDTANRVCNKTRVLLNSNEVRSGQVRTRSESKNGQVDFTLR